MRWPCSAKTGASKWRCWCIGQRPAVPRCWRSSWEGCQSRLQPRWQPCKARPCTTRTLPSSRIACAEGRGDGGSGGTGFPGASYLLNDSSNARPGLETSCEGHPRPFPDGTSPPPVVIWPPAAKWPAIQLSRSRTRHTLGPGPRRRHLTPIRQRGYNSTVTRRGSKGDTL
jgi:hypothetical protein